MGLFMQFASQFMNQDNVAKLIETAERCDAALELAIHAKIGKPFFEQYQLYLPTEQIAFMYETLLAKADSKYQNAQEYWDNWETKHPISIVGDQVWYLTHPVDDWQFVIMLTKRNHLFYTQVNYVKGQYKNYHEMNVLLNVTVPQLQRSFDGIYFDVYGFRKIEQQELYLGIGELTEIMDMDSMLKTTGDYRWDVTHYPKDTFMRIEQYGRPWLGIPIKDRMVAYPVVPSGENESVTTCDQRHISCNELLARVLDLLVTGKQADRTSVRTAEGIRYLLTNQPGSKLDSIVRQAVVHARL